MGCRLVDGESGETNPVNRKLVLAGTGGSADQFISLCLIATLERSNVNPTHSSQFVSLSVILFRFLKVIPNTGLSFQAKWAGVVYY